MLCSLLFIDAKCTGFLIDAEAKTKKDELIVNDNDLKECESVKTRIKLFQVIGKWNMIVRLRIKPMR